MSKRVVMLLSFIFIISCSNNSNIPSDIIKPSQMQNILWDIIRGDVLAQEIVKGDSTTNIKKESFAITQKIFFIHHINRDKFEKSMVFYEKHPELLKTIFDSLNAVKTRERSFKSEKINPRGIHPRLPRALIKTK
jgi:hypothetical protein